MTIPFYKYQGTGNDFILIDQITESNQSVPQDPDLIEKLCDRKFGIGADGIIYLQKHPQYDFEMVYYNPDASKSFCGNGSRCAVHLARQLQVIGDHAQFLAIDEVHTASIDKGIVSVSMQDVAAIERIGSDYLVNTGSPHYIQLVDDVTAFDVAEVGKLINSWREFKNVGVNVNMVQLVKIGPMIMPLVRTYERGVNSETLSCGTGVVAATLVASMQGAISPTCIRTQGGVLKVSFSENKGVFTNIYLTGPAKPVFQGQVTV